MRSIYEKIVKPIVDFCVAIVIFILVFPVFFVVSIVLFIDNKGEVYFFQERPGKNEKIFKIIKFKTMNDNRDISGNFLPDAERLTKIGIFIRKYSIDEIPQLLNVLKGEMSLVGPRPLLPQYLTLYSNYQKRRHEVRPGITGWAQVNGRNAISWNQKFDYDVWYVDNVSFLLDLKIIFLTVMKIFNSEGISSSTSATMEVFKGNN